MPKLYTVTDLAVLFSRHKQTIREWIADGIFPRAFRVRDGWYVPEGDVKKLIRTPDQLLPELPPRQKLRRTM